MPRKRKRGGGIKRRREKPSRIDDASYRRCAEELRRSHEVKVAFGEGETWPPDGDGAWVKISANEWNTTCRLFFRQEDDTPPTFGDTIEDMKAMRTKLGMTFLGFRTAMLRTVRAAVATWAASPPRDPRTVYETAILDENLVIRFLMTATGEANLSIWGRRGGVGPTTGMDCGASTMADHTRWLRMAGRICLEVKALGMPKSGDVVPVCRPTAYANEREREDQGRIAGYAMAPLKRKGPGGAYRYSEAAAVLADNLLAITLGTAEATTGASEALADEHKRIYVSENYMLALVKNLRTHLHVELLRTAEEHPDVRVPIDGVTVDGGPGDGSGDTRGHFTLSRSVGRIPTLHHIVQLLKVVAVQALNAARREETARSGKECGGVLLDGEVVIAFATYTRVAGTDGPDKEVLLIAFVTLDDCVSITHDTQSPAALLWYYLHKMRMGGDGDAFVKWPPKSSRELVQLVADDRNAGLDIGATMDAFDSSIRAAVKGLLTGEEYDKDAPDVSHRQCLFEQGDSGRAGQKYHSDASLMGTTAKFSSILAVVNVGVGPVAGTHVARAPFPDGTTRPWIVHAGGEVPMFAPSARSPWVDVGDIPVGGYAMTFSNIVHRAAKA